MRAPFNTTCELFAGSGTLTPGVSRGIFPCRFVREGGIHSQQLDPGQPWIPAYLTIQAYRPIGWFYTPKFRIDPTLADVVAIPAGAIPAWTVFYTDFIRWHGQPRYYRSYLVRIADALQGGILLEGLASITPPFPLELQGIVCGGSATPILLTLPAGGPRLGGFAHIVPNTPLVGPGGVVIGGLALVIPPGKNPLGGIVIGGNASIIPGKPFSFLGGVVLGGSATILPPGPPQLSGGVVLGGLAKIIPGSPFVLGGGVVLGGHGSYSPVSGLQGMFVGYNNFTPVEVDLETSTGAPSGLITGDQISISNMVHSPYLNGNWTLTALGGGLAYSLNGSNGSLVTNPGVDVGPTGAVWVKL